MAESGKKAAIAIAPKAPRPMAVPTDPITIDPIDPDVVPDTDPVTELISTAHLHQQHHPPQPPPAPVMAVPMVAAPIPAAGMPAVAATTAATDIINIARSPNPSAVDTRVGSAAGIHAVPTLGDKIGKYVVDRLLGSGGMGLVVAAKNEALNELVAIKLLRPKAAGDKIHAERFAREARAIIKIKSEHVVRVLDVDTLESGAPYIVMEYLVGKDLSQVLRDGGPMPAQRAADLMLQVCEAVASAHAAGVVHRDLKPSNFFLTQRADGTTLVKVLDFGISKAMAGSDGMPDPTLTETQAVFGSPTYMSPEQIRSAKHVDHRSDIWSMGVALYELVTGKLPFAADNVAGLLASIVADPPFYPRGFLPNIHPQLEELLLHLLQKDPKQRVQTVADFAFRLAPFATPNNETQMLVECIARLSNRTIPQAENSSTTTGPRLPVYPAPGSSNPMGGMGGMPIGHSSSPNIALSGSSPDLLGVMPPVGYQQSMVPNDARSSGITFGSTGMDLAAEAPRRGSNTLAAIAVGLCVAILILGGVGAYFLRPRVAASATPPPPSAETAPPASTNVAAAGSTPPPTKTAGEPADSANSASSAKPTKKPIAGPKHPTGPAPKPPTTAASATAKPVDPAGDRF